MDEAEFVCREALKIFPNHLDSYFILARICEKNEKYQEANECADRYASIRKAIEEHPEQFGKIINNTFSEAWRVNIIRGKAKYESGSRNEAKKIFKKVIQKDPQHWIAPVSIGHFYFNKFEFKEAAYYLFKSNKVKKDKLILYMLQLYLI